MKFRGDFQFNEYRLGHFYKSDVKNLAGAAACYPLFASDYISDLYAFVRDTAEREDSLFFSIKGPEGFFGYGYFFPIIGDTACVELIKRPMVRADFRQLKQIALCIVHFGFDVLRLDRIAAPMVAGWRPIEIVARLAGFKYEGTMRRGVSIKGKKHDMLMYSILREEV